MANVIKQDYAHFTYSSFRVTEIQSFITLVNQGYFILNFSILYIYENTLLPALDNASLAICKASKFIAKI